MQSEMILFEHPATEHIRICLQLEELFNELQNNLNNENAFNKAQAFLTLLRIIEITERPDLKSKLTQALTQHATTLAQLDKLPQINSDKLRHVLHQLDEQITLLHNMQQKIGESLQRNDFLKQARLQINNPGGLNHFKSPAYWCWLNFPKEICIETIKNWQQKLAHLKTSSKLVLTLLRDSAEVETVQTEKGFYHQSLNAALPCQLVRLFLPAHLHIYPEFSVGRHRVSVRLLKPSFISDARATTITENIEFQIACCRL